MISLEKNLTKIALVLLLTSGVLASSYFIYTRDNRVSISLPVYDSEIGTNPIDLGAVTGDRVYVALHAKFKVTGVDGYPNLFQTAHLNEGLRIEINGKNMVLILNNSTSTGDNSSYLATNITSDLEINKWNELELTAKDGSHVSVTLNGKETRVDIANIKLNASQIILGSGFVADRKFVGIIEDATLTKGNYPANL
jgi:hypothetical protein